MKKIALTLALLTLVGALSGCAALSPAPEAQAPAAPADTPAPAPQYQYFTAEEVKAMIEEGADKLIVDVQPEEYYALGHLPGSVATYAYPADTDALKERLNDAIVQIKATVSPVIVVGLGGKTGAENAVDYYVEQGVAAERLYILEGGAMSWPYEELIWIDEEFQYITPDQVVENFEKDVNMMIIDVRAEEDYNAGHLPGAISTGSYPNETKEQWDKLDALIEDIEATIDPVVIVCPSGGAGAINAISHYAAMGVDYRKFYILSGGGKTWPYQDMLEVTPNFQYITPAELKLKLDAEEEMLILSVQTKENYREMGHLPDSIPTYAFPADTPELWEELEDHADDLRDESHLPIYVMCHGGQAGAVNAITYYVNHEDIPEERFFIIEGGITNWPYPEMLETGR